MRWEQKQAHEAQQNVSLMFLRHFYVVFLLITRQMHGNIESSHSICFTQQKSGTLLMVMLSSCHPIDRNENQEEQLI